MAQVKAHKNYICDLWVGDWINIVSFFIDWQRTLKIFSIFVFLF